MNEEPLLASDWLAGPFGPMAVALASGAPRCCPPMGRAIVAVLLPWPACPAAQDGGSGEGRGGAGAAGAAAGATGREQVRRPGGAAGEGSEEGPGAGGGGDACGRAGVLWSPFPNGRFLPSFLSRLPGNSLQTPM